MALTAETSVAGVELAVLAAWGPAVGLPMTLAVQQGLEFWLQVADILQEAVAVAGPLEC
jgi:hypothetical protein